MKLIASITSALLSAVLLAGAAWPHASAASLPADFPETPASAAASSMDEGALQLRQYLKSRTESFTIEVSGSFITSNKDIERMFAIALEETGDSTEGDYIRWSIRSYGYDPVYTRGGLSALNFNIGYNTTAAQEAELDGRIEKIEESLHLDGKSEYEKILIVYDYVTSNVDYAEDDGGRLIFSAYDAVVGGEAVCQGYAQLVYRLLTDSGVSCRFVPGLGNGGNHAWNIAAIDGDYYWLDTTWDANIGAGSHTFFLRGESDFDALTGSNAHSLDSWPDLDGVIYADYASGDFLDRYPLASKAYDKSLGTKVTLGDIDGNGLTDSVDASALLSGYALLSTVGDAYFTARQSSAAELNGDGLIDAADASLILMYYSYSSTGGSMTLPEYIKTV